MVRVEAEVGERIGIRVLRINRTANPYDEDVRRVAVAVYDKHDSSEWTGLHGNDDTRVAGHITILWKDAQNRNLGFASGLAKMGKDLPSIFRKTWSLSSNSLSQFLHEVHLVILRDKATRQSADESLLQPNSSFHILL